MVPEQEAELLGLLCLLHKHAEDKEVDFFWGGGGGGGYVFTMLTQETSQISIASEHGICCRHFQHRLVNQEGH